MPASRGVDELGASPRHGLAEVAEDTVLKLFVPARGIGRRAEQPLKPKTWRYLGSDGSWSFLTVSCPLLPFQLMTTSDEPTISRRPRALSRSPPEREATGVSTSAGQESVAKVEGGGGGRKRSVTERSLAASVWVVVYLQSTTVRCCTYSSLIPSESVGSLEFGGSSETHDQEFTLVIRSVWLAPCGHSHSLAAIRRNRRLEPARQLNKIEETRHYLQTSILAAVEGEVINVNGGPRSTWQYSKSRRECTPPFQADKIRSYAGICPLQK